MHYYQFNIADYRKDTGHLSLLEHGIYRSLLDTYYLNESPLSGDESILMRTHSIRLEDEKNAMRNVLADFFNLTKKGYTHKNCAEQIKKYNGKSDKARVSANKRWHANAPEKDANAMRTHSEGNANHKPITINHKPIKETTWLLPVWVNKAAWIEFENHRKEIRKPLTDLSRTKAANLLEHFSNDEQQSFIDNTIQNRWTGIFTKNKGNQNENNNAANSKPVSNHARVIQALQDQGRANN